MEQANNQPPIVEVVAAQAPIRYASFGIRFVAIFIDMIILEVAVLVGKVLLGGSAPALSSSLGLVLTWGYNIFMINNYQATLGKKAVGICVVSEESGDLTLGQIILRETILKSVSIILFLGYIVLGFVKKNQALHDKIAGTVVVYKNK
ncbi:MAG: RDD family protein [Parcubacteria group bacterium]